MIRPSYILVTSPTMEPMSYQEAAAQLRVDSTDDMAYINSLIAVAREYVDNVTGRVSIASSWLCCAPSWQSLISGSDNDCRSQSRIANLMPLFRTPLRSITSVKYYAPDAAVLTAMSTNDYRAITTSEPGILQITGDLPDVDERPDAIQVTFSAGYDAPNCVPPGLKHAMKMLVSHLYEERKPIAFGQPIEIPYTLSHLINMQRVKGWFA